MAETEELPEEGKLKRLSEMFKNIKGATMAAGPLGMVFEALGFLEPVLTAFQPLLDVVGALFEVMGAAIIPQVVEALQPLMDALLDMMPMFSELGASIGHLIAMGLSFLVNILVMLSPIISAVVGVLIMLFDAFEPILDVFFDLLYIILEPLEPLLKAITPVIQLIGTVLAWLIDNIFKGFVIAIYWIGEAIIELIDIFTWGPTRIRTAWREMFADLFETMGIPLTSTLKKYTTSETTSTTAGAQMQEGGFTLGRGFAYLHPNEVVTPAPQLESQRKHQIELEFLMEENNRLLREIYIDKMWRHR